MISAHSLHIFSYIYLEIEKESEAMSRDHHNRTRQPPSQAKEEEEEEDPLDRMLNKTGCVDLHYQVQFCMAEKKDWRLCQKEVLDFKTCMNAKNAASQRRSD
eukprot:TRINITY_DN1103_c0_g1_i3.p1 TRINITY_DN1103_c0_g1~~TRINITY_DN1103_c0_g1_i3.p1  ORF type:complete len:102 (-),score=28.57 TRINITY_DN1103_c0_g1_i3:803-1108(-)